MIKGSLCNFKIIAQANMNDIIRQEIEEQQRQLETKSNKIRDEKNLDYLISTRISKNRQHPVFQYAKMVISDGLGQVGMNNQLIKPSYLLAVQNIPLPSKELEEKILANQKQKLNEYKDIQQIISGEMFVSGVKEQNANLVYKSDEAKFKKSVMGNQSQNDNKENQIENDDQSENKNKNKNNYFFDLQTAQNMQSYKEKEKNENQEITDFMNFAMVQDRNLAEKYVQMFPGNTEKQVKEYFQDKKKEEEFSNNISIFKSKTDASGATAIQYLNQYDNVVVAIEKYQKKRQKEQLKDAIIEFKNIKMCSDLVAEQYIKENKDLVKALEQYEKDQVNKKQNLIKQMQGRTGLDKKMSEFYLEMNVWDLDAACNFYQQNS